MSKQAADALEAIWEHWAIHLDVPTHRAAEMRDELAQHLSDAEADGKRVADVTGPDLRAFANEWARHERDSTPLSGVATFVQGALAGACGLVFAKVLVDRSLDLSVPVVETVLGILALAGLAFLILGPPGSRLRNSSTPVTKGAKALLAGLAGGASFVLVTVLTVLIDSDLTLDMPRFLVVLMASAGALLLFVLPLHALGLSPLRILRWVTH